MGWNPCLAVKGGKGCFFVKEVKARKVKKSTLIRIGLIALCIYMVAMLIITQTKINDRNRQQETLKEQIVLQQLKNEKMRLALEEDDPEYIEQIAREEFGYVKPGEKVFVDISGN